MGICQCLFQIEIEVKACICALFTANLIYISQQKKTPHQYVVDLIICNIVYVNECRGSVS